MSLPIPLSVDMDQYSPEEISAEDEDEMKERDRFADTVRGLDLKAGRVAKVSSLEMMKAARYRPGVNTRLVKE